MLSKRPGNFGGKKLGESGPGFFLKNVTLEMPSQWGMIIRFFFVYMKILGMMYDAIVTL